MQDTEREAPEPTLADLAEQLDLEGMVGFTRTFHHDLRDGFQAVSVEHFPFLVRGSRHPRPVRTA